MAEHDPSLPSSRRRPKRRQLAASDLRAALGWIAFGAAVLVGSLTMDRLESQGINPYTVPGLLPGLLGIAMILLGAHARACAAGVAAERCAMRGVALPIGPRCAGCAIVLALSWSTRCVLVGHGMPFWLASAIYVTRLDPARCSSGSGATARGA